MIQADAKGKFHFDVERGCHYGPGQIPEAEFHFDFARGCYYGPCISFRAESATFRPLIRWSALTKESFDVEE